MVRTYEPLYTVKEVAKILKTNPAGVYEFVNRGQLPCLILGSKKIRGTDLECFIEQYPVINPREEEPHAEVL